MSFPLAIARTAFALVVLAGAAPAQFTTTTFFATNNSGAVGGAVYFDLAVARSIEIDSIDANFLEAPGTAVGLQVYTAPTTFVGNEGNMAAWTLVAQDDGTAQAAGMNAPTRIPLQSSFTLAAGNHGIALVAVNAQHAYTNGNGLNQVHRGFGVVLSAGAASNVPFDGFPFDPRVWNGSLHYSMDTGCLVHTVSSADANLRGVDLADGTILVSRGITVAGETVTAAHGLARIGGSVFTALTLVGQSDSFLATLDLALGAATVIGSLGDDFASLATAPDGTLVGITTDGATVPSTLFAIDPATATTMALLPLGIGSDGEAIAWHADYRGLLHASGRDGQLNDPANGPNLEVIAPRNGVAKALRLSGFPSDQITALLAAPNRAILAATLDGELVTIDRKGVITQNVAIGHVASGLLPRDPMGGAVRGKLSVKLRFDVADADAVALKLQGVVLDPAFDANGASVELELGTEPSGVVTLDERGRFAAGTGSLTFKQSRRDGTWTIQLKVKGADLSGLAALGFTNADQSVNLPLCVRLTTALDRVETVFVLNYRARVDRGGKAR